MRRIIGSLGSIGVGVMLTAAGLALDAKTLTYAGIVIFALMLALSLWAWARPAVSVASQGGPATTPILNDTPPPTDLTDKEKALFLLKRARDNAMIARKQKGDEAARLAYHEFLASTLSIKREFGFGTLNTTGKGTIPFKAILEAYIAYADRIYPLLREGHVEEARAKAKAFKWSWSEE